MNCIENTRITSGSISSSSSSTTNEKLFNIRVMRLANNKLSTFYSDNDYSQIYNSINNLPMLELQSEPDLLYIGNEFYACISISHNNTFDLNNCTINIDISNTNKKILYIYQMNHLNLKQI